MFQITKTHTKQKLLSWTEKKQVNGANLDHTQCDSPLHNCSKSLRKLLISWSYWSKWNLSMLSPDTASGLTVGDLYQQGWRCDSREKGIQRMHEEDSRVSSCQRAEVLTKCYQLFKGVGAGCGQLTPELHAPYYPPSFEHTLLLTPHTFAPLPGMSSSIL